MLIQTPNSLIFFGLARSRFSMYTNIIVCLVHSPQEKSEEKQRDGHDTFRNYKILMPKKNTFTLCEFTRYKVACGCQVQVNWVRKNPEFTKWSRIWLHLVSFFFTFGFSRANKISFEVHELQEYFSVPWLRNYIASI